MGEVKHQNGRRPGISKETAMALYIDISAIAGQVRIIRAVTKRYAPLLQKVSGECTEDIVNDFVIKLRGLIFSYKVTTIFADGSRETVRALRFKGCVKDFATTFWQENLIVFITNFLSSNRPLRGYHLA